MKPKIYKVLVAEGLIAVNKEVWKGKVLFFLEELDAILEDRNIVFVKYDHHDGRGIQEYSGDKIRNINPVLRNSSSGRQFAIFNEVDIT